MLLVVLGRSALSGITPATLALTLLLCCPITAGTLYQKRYCGAVDLRTGSVIQFCAAALVLLPLALTFESMRVHSTVRSSAPWSGWGWCCGSAPYPSCTS